MNQDTVLVTGGAGFIGSNFTSAALKLGYKVIILDKLTYSGNLDNLAEESKDPNYHFIKGDICDTELVNKILTDYKPSYIVHFAAESHVDNSIYGPLPFITTNITGSFSLLESARNYWNSIGNDKDFKFIHISTDEVYGSLNPEDIPFDLNTPYNPSSPYSASKAASDHLAKSWHKTYKLPVIISNCTNNFGPKQHQEKLIPKTIISAINGWDIEIYGNGQNIRDWIYVGHHVEGILQILKLGTPGKQYLFGGDQELSNIDLVLKICDLIKEKIGKDAGGQIKFIQDRPGHDFRYAVNSAKTRKELNLNYKENFHNLLRLTIDWYISNTKSQEFN
ncbi:MAG: dTDP-glucose 4,6-dehydratase [Rickettsiaceae bacterium]|nr:dTDP-glucose 4,6-dehydratase [Rickettsiaceae bacterium]